MIRQGTRTAATKTYAVLLAEAEVPMQVRLIAALAARGDTAAHDAVKALAETEHQELQLAGPNCKH